MAKKKKLHRTILILLLMFLPPFFLVFTEEGNRVSDNVMLWLFGQESVSLDLAAADSNFSESDIRKVFPNLDWQCGSVESPFGQEACNASIGTFNELPARHLVMFFAHQRLNAIQISYRAKYHNRLLRQLLDNLGHPRNLAAAQSTPDPDTVLEWHTGKGLIVLKKQLAESDQPALLWLARRPSE